MDGKLLKDNTKATNVTAGNAWIICKSKSHPGINYYFNTLTGKAVWNISDAEIEKAKAKTKLLESQPGNNLQKCPEPKEPPLSPPPPHNSNFACHNSNFSIQSGVILLEPPCGSQSDNASQFYNSLGLMNAVPINIAIPGLNTNGWPQPQFFVNPLVNQIQSNLQPFNKAEQDVHNRIGSTNYHNINNNIQQNLNYQIRSHNNICPSTRSFCNHNSNFESDLRQKLETVRNNQRSHYNKEDQVIHNNEGKVQRNTKDYTKTSENFTYTDLIPLRKLSPLDTVHNSWYIVVDTNTVLNNFGFLANLTDSDKTCYLLVPKCVMEKLQTLAKKNLNARRILRFVSQQIETGLIKTEEKLKYDDCVQSNIFDLCVNLSLKKHHVVLLSDNLALSKYKGMSRVVIMTVFELKKLLNHGSSKISPQKAVPFEKQIKITVPNNIENTTHQKATTINCHKEYEMNVTQQTEKTESICENKILTDNSTDFQLNDSNSNTSQQTSCKITSDMYTKISSFKNEDPASRINVDTISKVPENFSQPSRLLDNEQDKTVKIPVIRKRVINLRQNFNVTERVNNRKRWTIRKRRDDNIVTADESSIQTTTDGVNSAVTDKTKSSPNEGIIEEQIKTSNDNIEFSNDCSSTNSVIVSKNVRENVIIDESSMSGVTSNTESNFDLESLTNYKTKFIREAKKPIQRNVMVEIPSAIVEEHLSMRCEEWMFRFTQIMEEVLSQILQQDPPFLNSDFPPPWTLHEATQCIIKKFSHCCYVVDAANKLSIVLYELSDGKGKMSSNINPSQYMEMYSYGIYLIKALQDIKKDCEDLKTASTLLKKLLDDIHNPTIDNINNETFVEEFTSASRTFIPPTNPDRITRISKPEKPQYIEATSKCLNSQEKIQLCEEQNTNSTTEDLNLISVDQTKISSKPNEQLSVEENKETNDENDNTTVEYCQPKIIRVFTKCPEFENRSGFDYEFDEDEDIFDENYDYLEENLEDSETFDNPTIPDEVKVKQFFSILSKEIKDTYLEIMALCDTSCKDLLDVNIPNRIKTTIGVKVEQARSHISNLYNALDSILHRDESNPDEHINYWLKRADVDVNFDQSFCDDYKKLIKNCKDQAETFITTIDIILKAAKL